MSSSLFCFRAFVTDKTGVYVGKNKKVVGYEALFYSQMVRCSNSPFAVLCLQQGAGSAPYSALW